MAACVSTLAQPYASPFDRDIDTDPAHWEDGQYLLEMEDSSDPAKPGSRFTAAAERAQTKKWQRLMANRRPRKNISTKYIAKKGHKPPLLLYGWPFKGNYMIEYAKRHKLSFIPQEGLRHLLGGQEVFCFSDIREEHYLDDDLLLSLRHIAMTLTLTKLVKATGVPLEIGRPFSLEYDAMVVMWTNYSFEEVYGRIEGYGMDYDEIVKTLDEAMNDALDGERTKLRWWWSWGNGINIFSAVD